MPTDLIIGYGYLGEYLAKNLINQGRDVIALKRRNCKTTEGVKLFTLDLLSYEDCPHLHSFSFDTAYFMVSADHYNKMAYERAYYKSLERALELLDSLIQQPSRLVFVSSTSCYGQNNGEDVDELSLTHPNDFAGEVMLRAEELVSKFFIPSTIMRFSGLYGPQRWHILRDLTDKKQYLLKNDVYTNRIHVEDAANALYYVSQLESPEDVYVASDSAPCLRNDFIRWLCQELGIDSKTLPIEEQRRSSRATNKRCINKRLLDTGFEFRYPDYKTGYQSLIKEFLEHHH